MSTWRAEIPELLRKDLDSEEVEGKYGKYGNRGEDTAEDMNATGGDVLQMS